MEQATNGTENEDLSFEEQIDQPGDRERFEILMEQKLDFSKENCFPEEIKRELEKPGPYSDELRAYLRANSLICHEVETGNPASDKICRVVYSDAYFGWGPIDDWISRGLGGKALFNRLPRVSTMLESYLVQEAFDKNITPFVIKDLGAGSGSYAFRTLGNLRTKNFPIETIDWQCIDLSEDAIRFGTKRSEEDGFTDSIRFIKNNFMSSKSYPFYDTEKADLIILVGVLCGMTKEDSIKCLKRVSNHGKSNAKIIAATLKALSYKENPHVYQVLAKLGWLLKPKTESEVEDVFEKAGYKIIAINSERLDEEGNEIEGEYAIVTAKQ